MSKPRRANWFFQDQLIRRCSNRMERSNGLSDGRDLTMLCISLSSWDGFDQFCDWCDAL